jgi:hypothetical protein
MVGSGEGVISDTSPGSFSVSVSVAPLGAGFGFLLMRFYFTVLARSWRANRMSALVALGVEVLASSAIRNNSFAISAEEFFSERIVLFSDYIYM